MKTVTTPYLTPAYLLDLKEEGIFRIPGSVGDVNAARDLFDKGLVFSFLHDRADFLRSCSRFSCLERKRGHFNSGQLPQPCN